MKNLPQNQKAASTPSSQVRKDHRKWIGGRVLTLLSHYWRDDDPVELTAAIGRDWATVLEGMPQEVIELACVAYMREEPRRKPTPGEIYQRCRLLMPRPEVVKTQPDEEKMRRMQDRSLCPTRGKIAAEILASVGLSVPDDVKPERQAPDVALRSGPASRSAAQSPLAVAAREQAEREASK